MDLIFTKSETGKSWVAEFEATADFNLHIERDKGGNLMLYQRTNGGGWDIVNDFANPRFGAIDYDCTALIYPKFIKVVSEVEPTYAAVTSAGEVTEIKSQDKSVEVTSNGTIDVTPDAGFAYLNKVSVKTNVAQSGGGGSASASYKYYDLRAESAEIKTPLIMYAALLVRYNGAELYNMPIASFCTEEALNEVAINNTIAIMTDLNLKINMGGDGTFTVSEMMAMFGANNLKEITEEEFYTL